MPAKINIYNIMLMFGAIWEDVVRKLEADLEIWDIFREQVRDRIVKTERQDHARRILDDWIEQVHETVAMFAEDMTRLFRCAEYGGSLICGTGWKL